MGFPENADVIVGTQRGLPWNPSSTLVLAQAMRLSGEAHSARSFLSLLFT